MKTDAEGAILLNDTEKEIVIKGLKLMSLFCDSRLGCKDCPFFTGKSGEACELKSYLPCAWTIPDEFKRCES